MATLAVRPLTALDVPALRHVRQRVAILDWDMQREVDGMSIAQQVYSAVAPGRACERSYVALVDNELCATLSMRPQTIAYCWDVATLAAGSTRLNGDDSTVLELWTALLNYGIVASGSLGVRRLFAAADEDSVSCKSLRSSGFEPYTRQTMLHAEGIAEAVGAPRGMRRMESSDTWSVHHLYHSVTPRPVQFAEARISAAWESPARSMLDRITPSRRDVHQYVLETVDGIVAYCRISIQRHRARVDLLMDRSARAELAGFVAAAIDDAGAAGCRLDIVIPQYSIDLIPTLEQIGFAPVGDRIALVRHTTAPAVVHGRFAVASIDGERAPKSVPSYYRSRSGSRQSASVAVESYAIHRMER